MKTKKIILILVGVISFILLTIIILPFIFKNKILETVKVEINKNINAEVNWESVSFSLIKSFPDFKLELKNFSVKGIHSFANDTLMSVDNFGIQINLMSVFKGDEYEIKAIDINKARINAIVLKDGTANWDIVKPTEEIPEEEEPAKFAVALKKINIKDSYIKYRDDEMDFMMEISGLNHRLRGNLTESTTKIRTKTTADALSVSYEGIGYLKNAPISSDFDMDANMDTWRFDFLDNFIKVNELLLNFEGWFQMNDENFDMDMKFSTPSTEFKHFLSMIPAIYAKDFNQIETKGEFAFSAQAKGIYDSLNLPAFEMQMNVKNGFFKYPDLPQSVNNINIDTKISNKGGSADNTIIDVRNFSLTMAQNPIAMKLFVSTPVSDPNIDFSAKGKLDFKTINTFYPLEEGQKLDGTMMADILFKGRYSMIEKEQYEKFVANGLIEITDMFYSDKDMPKGLKIPYGKMSFSPKYADLSDLQIKMEDSDLNIKGRIDNILDYVFDKAPLVGRFNIQSKYFNTQSFLPTSESAPTETPETAENAQMEAFDVPKNIDFSLTASFGKLIYDDLELKNMRGEILVKEQKAELKNLRFDVLDGETVINGFYSSAMVLPKVGFALNINQVDIQKSWNSFEIIKKFAPIAENAKGKFSGNISIDTDLNKDLSPRLETLNSKGSIQTKSIAVIGSPMMAKLAAETKIAAFKQLNLANLSVQYFIKDGKLTFEPFNIILNDIKMNVSGFSRLDQSLDYLLAIEVPRKAFGNAANDFVNSLTGQLQQKGVPVNLNEKIKFDVQIIGTFSNPVFKTGLKAKAGSVVDDVKDQVKEKVEEVKQEVISTVKEEVSKAIAEAKKRADALMVDARRNADAVRAEAKRAGDALIQEADAQGKKLIAEAKNPVAKLAAEKSAKALNDEAKSKADKLNKEAEQKANQILKTAQDEGDRIVQEAEQKAK
jgi:hypothetical protein